MSLGVADVLGALALGLVVGMVSGVVGIGGGALLVPALVLFFGLTQRMAQGTSIAMLLLPTGILAFWEYHRAGQVHVKLALLLALGFMVGGWFGGKWAQHLPELVLRRCFAGLLLIIAVRLMLPK